MTVAIAAAIERATGKPFTPRADRAAGGGCINTARILEGSDGRRYFVKTNRASRLAMFEAEAAGLEAIRATGTVRVPTPICSGSSGDEAWLVLEYLDMGGRGSAADLGRRLAALHRQTWDRYGWHRDNTIGSTPQINTPCADWIEFYRVHRLGHQYALAVRHGAPHRLLKRGEQLLAGLEGFFVGHRPAPSLLHGDLWGGNFAYCQGEPVLFDPAVYFGDREADLAMTELFGGFPGDFYAAYREAWPMDAGYRVRKDLYNLYHVLNHFNLFGGGYLPQAEHMTERLLAELSA
ncbi:MAG: fructosamine kinase family protein [Thiobacillaceae bacterium]